MSERLRLDVALERRGLAPSRARARDAVLRGTVRINGVLAARPAQKVSEADAITLDDPASGYVSRAALKLAAALEATGFDPRGRICLDLGAATGGFTQILLDRGAARVYAVDVGHGQLHPEIAARPEVIALEGVDARALDRSLVLDPVALLVCDVSFVGVAKIIAVPSSLCAPDAQAILLIKPQFEVGREHIGKGGIVVPGPHVDAAVQRVVAAMEGLGWTLVAKLPSPLKGGEGNAEYLAAFRRGHSTMVIPNASSPT